jgi:hypothetical protein
MHRLEHRLILPLSPALPKVRLQIRHGPDPFS